jgi:hypothetical protein
MDDGGRVCTDMNVDYAKKMLPIVRLMNAINRVNDAKARTVIK